MSLDEYKQETPDEGISYNQLKINAQIEKGIDLIAERKEDRKRLLFSDLPKGFTHEDFIAHLDLISWYKRLILRLEVVVYKLKIL